MNDENVEHPHDTIDVGTVELTGEAQADLVKLIANGQKVQALRLYRKFSGASLNASKAALNEIARSTGQPDLFPPGTIGLAMFTAVVVVFVIAAVIITVLGMMFA